MELSEFNSHYLTNLLNTPSSDNETVVLLRDFNTDLLEHDQNNSISDFLDLMYSSLLLPHTYSPSRTTTS